jgi:hypothetical protein
VLVTKLSNGIYDDNIVASVIIIIIIIDVKQWIIKHYFFLNVGVLSNSIFSIFFSLFEIIFIITQKI